MKAIIVDDELNARKVLRGLLGDHFPEIEVVADCKDVPEAVKSINKLKPELVFLDVAMPGYSGFELLDFFEKGDVSFKIIFVTAYSEYSLRAFESSAVDYILKPVRLEHLQRAIKKVIDTGSAGLLTRYEVLKENYQYQEKKIVLQTAETIYVVKKDDIVYLQAEGSYTKFFTTTHGVLTITKKLIDFEYLEADGLFFRVHRSYVVNINHIKKVDKKEYLIIMSNDAAVYLSHDKKSQLIDKVTA